MGGEWAGEVRFGQILKHRKERGRNDDPLLSVTQDNGVVPQAEAGRRNISSTNKQTYWRVYPGDVVYNTMRMWQGASGCSAHFGIVSPAYTVCEPATGVLPRYVAYLLKHPDYTAKFTSRCQGLTSDVWNLKFSEFSKIHLSLPPLPEQRRIAEILDTLDAAIRKTEQVIAKLQRMKQGLLHDLLTRGIDQHGHLRNPHTHPEQFKPSPLGKIPKEWEVVRLDQSAVEIIDGDRGVHYPHGDELYKSGYCLFLSATNVTRSGFRFNTVQFIDARKDRLLGTGKLTRGDVVITTRGTVGNIAYYDGTVPFDHVRINSGMVILRSTEGGLDPRFLHRSLTDYIFEHEFKKVVSGSAQPQLPIRDMEQFHLMIPSPSEQRRLLSATEGVYERLDYEEAQLAKLRLLKQGLMDDLLMGRRRVRVKGEG